MSNYGKKSSAKSNKELEEVEELLRATEDEMILNLSVNSHASRTSSSSSPLDQDLMRRFEALKAPSTAKKITNVPPGTRVLKKEKKKDGNDGGLEKIVGDDPFARFSALKTSGNKSSTSAAAAAVPLKLDGDRSENEEDEVSKLIQWAMDAARLDPSLSSSEEDSDDPDEHTDDDTDDDDAAAKKKKKKKKPAK